MGALVISVAILLGTSTWAATNWKEKVLHSFGNGADGANPDTSLTIDAAGNLYGATQHGGPDGYGTVFKVSPGNPWTGPCCTTSARSLIARTGTFPLAI